MLVAALSLVIAQTGIPSEVSSVLDRLRQVHPRIVPTAPTSTFMVEGRPAMLLVVKEEYGAPAPQQATAGEPKLPPKYNCSQIIIVSGDKKLASTAPVALPWQDLEQSEATSIKFLGIGEGYAWYGKVPPHEAVWVIQLGGLHGGEEPVDLAFESLGMAREENLSYAQTFLAAFPDRSLPRLIDLARSDNPRWESALRTIAMIDSDKSTKFLISFYAKSDTEKKRSVWRALETGPPRKEAKQLYFEMAKAGQGLILAARVAVLYQWPEFAPVIEDSLKFVDNLWEYRDAYVMSRSLRGIAVTPAVLRSLNFMTFPEEATPRQLSDAKSRLVNYGDPDPIVVSAFVAMRRPTKGAVLDNPFAKEILLSMPKFSVTSFLQRIVHESKDRNAVELARKVLAEIR